MGGVGGIWDIGDMQDMGVGGTRGHKGRGRCLLLRRGCGGPTLGKPSVPYRRVMLPSCPPCPQHPQHPACPPRPAVSPLSQVDLLFLEDFHSTPARLFQHFDYEPVAAASLAQVHRATLPDGTPVAVKVGGAQGTRPHTPTMGTHCPPPALQCPCGPPHEGLTHPRIPLGHPLAPVSHAPPHPETPSGPPLGTPPHMSDPTQDLLGHTHPPPSDTH